MGFMAYNLWRLGQSQASKAKSIIAFMAAGLSGLIGVSLIKYDISSYIEKKANETELFIPAAYHGKLALGEIRLDYKGNASLKVRRSSDNKLFEFVFQDGMAKAPVGSYEMDSLSLVDGDWTVVEKGLHAVFDKNHGQVACLELAKTMIEVRADSTARLSAGMPLTAEIGVNEDKHNKVSLSLLVSNRCNRITSLSKLGGRNYPSFEVLSVSGKILWHERFMPGCSNVDTYSGEIPSELPGKMIVRPKIDRCPFDVRLKYSSWVLRSDTDCRPDRY